MRKLILQARGITRIYPEGGQVHALRGVDLTVHEGDLAAVLGPSGAGKSTLLRILALLDRPTAGDLFYRTRLVSGLAEAELAAIRAAGIAHLPATAPEASQREAINRACAGRPELLLADEPTGRLDSAAGARILALLRELNQSGLAILLATDDPEAAAACPTIYRMRDGLLRPISG